MKAKNRLFIPFLALTLMGASKCQETQPPPHVSPDILGSWQWSCVDLAAPVILEQKPNPLEPLALSCAQQVPAKSPFMSYVKEHIEFKDATNWSAYFSFGTCVDSQDGTYKYSYDLPNKKDVLEVYDTQGTLQQTYSVEKVSDVEIKFSNDVKSCNLTKATAPVVLKGSHPKPAGTLIDWDFDVDGAATFWTTVAQFPFVYQSPQLQSRGTPFAGYRADNVLLNIAPDGSLLPHYAGFVVLYNNNTNAPLAYSDVKELVSGVIFQINFTDPNTGSIVKVKAQFN